MGQLSRDLGLLEELTLALAARGYTVDEPWRQGPMSSGSIALANPVSHIRLVADRGQWFIEIRPAQGDLKWFDLEQWSACLGEPVSFHVLAPSMDTKDVGKALGASWRLQPQVSWIERHIDAIESACIAAATSAVLECLRRRGGRD